jgi:hypothetical protein
MIPRGQSSEQISDDHHRARRVGGDDRIAEWSILIRLEMTAVFCFLWVTAISNRFDITIRNGVCLARFGEESDRVC